MGVVRGTYDLHKEAHRDNERHKRKLKDAFKDGLKDIISEENIITGQGNKKVKVPIKALDNYRFIFDHKQGDQTGQGDGTIQEGDIIGREDQEGEGGKPGKPGDEEGEEYYEAEIDVDELVEMMLEELKLPRLDPKKSFKQTTPETVWNDVSRRGAMSNLDKKRTIVQNMKRNAQQTGEAFVGGINNDDLRFRSWNEQEKPITSAVVIAMMDVSASMYTDKKYIARAFFFWMVQFLKKKYENVEIVFIAHTTTAKVVNEEDFFHRGESGGTKCSSAYKLADEIILNQYDPALWNIFAFHFSDGETWGDEVECAELVTKLARVCNMVGYGEIKVDDWYPGTLMAALNEVNAKNFYKVTLDSPQGIYPALKTFFSDEESLVSDINDMVNLIVSVRCVLYPEPGLSRFRCDTIGNAYMPAWARHPKCIATALQTAEGSVNG